MRFDNVEEALTYAVGAAYIRMGREEESALAATTSAEALERDQQPHDEDGFSVQSYRNMAARANAKAQAEEKLIGQCETLIDALKGRV